MRYLWLILPLLASGCAGKSDRQLQEEAHSAVVAKMAVFNDKEPCTKVMDMKVLTFGADADKMAMKLCGGIFDWEKPVVLSEVKIYHGKTPTVCGVASGTSRAGSHLGTRFVWNPTTVSAVNLKPVYPLLGSDKMRDAYHDLNKIYAVAERQYCK